jgi:hypothetical protein
MVLHPQLLFALLGVWWSHAGDRVAARPTPVPADAPIAWIGGAPTDEDAHLVWDTLTRRGVTRYAAVVEDVGERLFRRDLARLGGAADIGFFQLFYRAYARELLRGLDGSFVRIGRAP